MFITPVTGMNNKFIIIISNMKLIKLFHTLKDYPDKLSSLNQFYPVSPYSEVFTLTYTACRRDIKN